MVNARQQKDFATRLDELKHLLEQVQQDLENIKLEGEIAPSGCWIVRYQAKGRKGGRYWYYKWMSHDPIFVTKNGNPSRHQYLGKAGSEAYLKAVEALSRRGRIEVLDRAITTLSMGLSDLVERELDKIQPRFNAPRVADLFEIANKKIALSEAWRFVRH